jgi:hypothetical protein
LQHSEALAHQFGQMPFCVQQEVPVALAVVLTSLYRLLKSKLQARYLVERRTRELCRGQQMSELHQQDRRFLLKFVLIR